MPTELKEKGNGKKSGEVSTGAKPGAITSMFDDMEKVFGGIMGHGLMHRFMPPFKWPSEFEIGYPSVDIFEDSDKVTVKAELPGVEKDCVNVSINEDTITISGEKNKEEKVEKKDYYRLERSYGSFSRSLRLPAEVKADRASATFKDGVLEVTIPKTEKGKAKGVKVDIK